eukprot:5861754-Amphidinium_carterae.1
MQAELRRSHTVFLTGPHGGNCAASRESNPEASHSRFVPSAIVLTCVLSKTTHTERFGPLHTVSQRNRK